MARRPCSFFELSKGDRVRETLVDMQRLGEGEAEDGDEEPEGWRHALYYTFH